VATIARAAAVDRTFLYRHKDLLAQVHATQVGPLAGSTAGPASPGHPCKPTCSPPTNAPSVSAAASSSWKNACPKRSVSRPGENPGSAPADIDALNRKITQLEQEVIDLRLQLEERDGELSAARAANRDLMAQLNATRHG
jgi:hypothetical protein